MASSTQSPSVEIWRQRSYSDISIAPNLGHASLFYRAILHLFGKLVQAAKELNPPELPRTLVDNYAAELYRLYLWGDGFSTSDGELDKNLTKSVNLRDSVLLILEQLSRALRFDLMQLLSGSILPNSTLDEALNNLDSLQNFICDIESSNDVDPEWDEESLASSENSEQSGEGILEDIITYIDCLMDLNDALESPAGSANFALERSQESVVSKAGLASKQDKILSFEPNVSDQTNPHLAYQSSGPAALGEPGSSHQPIKRLMAPLQPACLLACPLYVLDSVKYRTCGDKKLRHNSELRTHLHRCHTQPHFCPICKLTFKGKNAYNNRRYHISAQKCAPSFISEPDGLTPDEFSLIAEKREVSPFPGLTPLAHQWYAIWEICCPGEPFPSPEFIFRTGSLESNRVADAGRAIFKEGRSDRLITDEMHPDIIESNSVDDMCGRTRIQRQV
ncbi:hypothetical protein QBC43DRAFT_336412 [Cladorrhinum sp. PSN259]|nr:hypothetical protein QBC43DRAFT_336412 [Cladorrhinum sp. PSN259]